jgi:hypothetical protein
MIAEKWGRTVKITLAQPGLGVFTITDWIGGRAGPSSFNCDFTITRHTRPEPQPASITIYGLSKETRSKISSLHKAAEATAFRSRRVLKAGQISIYAGYEGDAGLLFVGELAPNGVQTSAGNPQPALTLRALDGRVEWEGRFVKKAVGPGIDLRTIQGVLKAAGDFMSGKTTEQAFSEEFPELIKRREGPAVHEGGFVLFGKSQKVNRDLCRDLGIQPFFVDGELIYIARDAAILGEAVTLVRGRSILALQELALGRYQVTTLIDHRYRGGRQVLLREQNGKPIGAGVFRVDEATLTGSAGGDAFHAVLSLRPTVRNA